MFNVNGREYRVKYVPGESDTGLFGGNSNWRGPVWFPINYLIIEALERYHHFYGETLPRRVPDRLTEADEPAGSRRRKPALAWSIVSARSGRPPPDLRFGQTLLSGSRVGVTSSCFTSSFTPKAAAAAAPIIRPAGRRSSHAS